MSELSLSIVRNQLRTMSGKFEMNCGNGEVAIDLIIPQLKLEGGVS